MATRADHDAKRQMSPPLTAAAQGFQISAAKLENSAEAPPGTPPDPRFSEAMLAAFMGPRSETYLRRYRQMKRGDQSAGRVGGANVGLTIGWHWVAFLLTIPWLFYRKLYLGGIVLVVLPVLFEHIAPGALFFGSGLVIAVFTGLYAKSWYLGHALAKAGIAVSRFTDTEQRFAYMRRAGGVSVAGAIFGAVTQIATILNALRDALLFELF